MNYALFQKLRIAAAGIPDFDEFVQSVAPKAKPEDKLYKELKFIHETKNFRALKDRSGKSMQKLANAYAIPMPSISRWYSTTEEPKKYLFELLAFAIMSDMITD